MPDVFLFYLHFSFSENYGSSHSLNPKIVFAALKSQGGSLISLTPGMASQTLNNKVVLTTLIRSGGPHTP